MPKFCICYRGIIKFPCTTQGSRHNAKILYLLQGDNWGKSTHFPSLDLNLFVVNLQICPIFMTSNPKVSGNTRSIYIYFMSYRNIPWLRRMLNFFMWKILSWICFCPQIFVSSGVLLKIKIAKTCSTFDSLCQQSNMYHLRKRYIPSRPQDN